jgi:hypothetical protein
MCEMSKSIWLFTKKKKKFFACLKVQTFCDFYKKLHQIWFSNEDIWEEIAI